MIARADGQIVLVLGAIPGERVTARVERVAKGVVYVGNWSGRVYALSARTGATRWIYRTGGKVKSSATLAGARIYVGSYDGRVYCLNARTGRLPRTPGSRRRRQRSPCSRNTTSSSASRVSSVAVSKRTFPSRSSRRRL